MHVVLPVKRYAEAKTRLSGVLSAEQRIALAQAMLEDVLEQLSGWAAAERIVIVSDDPAVRPLAAAYGVDLVPEGVGPGLNAALENAASTLEARGVRRMLVLHADLPLLDRAELEAGLGSGDAAAEPELILVPDRARQGTNGLVCSLPLRLSLHYGPGSFLAHQREASARGVSVLTRTLPSLALDVDTEADVREVLERAEHQPSLRSRRTVRLLRSLLR